MFDNVINNFRHGWVPRLMVTQAYFSCRALPLRCYEYLSYAINICTLQVKLHGIYVLIEKLIRSILLKGAIREGILLTFYILFKHK